LERAARFAGLSPAQFHRSIRVIEHLPQIAVSILNVNPTKITVQLDRKNAVMLDQGHLQGLHPTSADLPSSGSRVKRTDRGRSIRRRSSDKGVRVYAPRFPKPQTEGFFILLSRPNSDEIVALKRITWQNEVEPTRERYELRAKTTISVPADLKVETLDILILSDAYIGMKWTVESVETLTIPMADA